MPKSESVLSGLPPLEDLAISQSGTPFFTSISHGLQLRNQVTLWELFCGLEVEIPKRGHILDLGCGDGLYLAIAPHMVFSHPLIGRRRIVGIDLDPKKVSTARNVARVVADEYAKKTITPESPEGHSLDYLIEVQDLTALDPTKLNIPGEESAKSLAAMAWSSSVFHWLKGDEAKYTALSGINRMLKTGGVFCLSMSAGGTARDFLDAYNIVLQKRGFYDSTGNPHGFYRRLFEPNPIGSLSLDHIADLMEETGFEVIDGVTRRERTVYSHPREYSQAVFIYGHKAFLAPLYHYRKEGQKSFWRDVEEEFFRILRLKNWKEGSPWEYYQYNNYIVAQKRAASAPQVSEGEKWYSVGSTLNQKFLEFMVYNLKPRTQFNVELRGTMERFEDAATPIELGLLIKGILRHSVAAWDSNDPIPSITIQYGISNGDLSLEFYLRAPNFKLKDHFKASQLSRWEELGMTMEQGYSDGTNIYKLKMPLDFKK